MYVPIIIGGYEFATPDELSKWSPSNDGGIYIIFKVDSGMPIYLPIYIEKSEKFSEENIGNKHKKYECWIKQADTLFVSSYVENDENKRMEIKKELTILKSPPCNMG